LNRLRRYARLRSKRLRSGVACGPVRAEESRRWTVRDLRSVLRRSVPVRRAVLLLSFIVGLLSHACPSANHLFRGNWHRQVDDAVAI